MQMLLKCVRRKQIFYYQGKNSAQAPVGVSIEYTLDGKAVTADELKGQSGHLVATVKLTNNTGEEVTVNGKKRTVYTPFFTVAAVSYTHLDVYKRQVHICAHAGRKKR